MDFSQRSDIARLLRRIAGFIEDYRVIWFPRKGVD